MSPGWQSGTWSSPAATTTIGSGKCSQFTDDSDTARPAALGPHCGKSNVQLKDTTRVCMGGLLACCTRIEQNNSKINYKMQMTRLEYRRKASKRTSGGRLPPGGETLFDHGLNSLNVDEFEKIGWMEKASE